MASLIVIQMVSSQSYYYRKTWVQNCLRKLMTYINCQEVLGQANYYIRAYNRQYSISSSFGLKV